MAVAIVVVAPKEVGEVRIPASETLSLMVRDGPNIPVGDVARVDGPDGDLLAGTVLGAIPSNEGAEVIPFVHQPEGLVTVAVQPFPEAAAAVSAHGDAVGGPLAENTRDILSAPLVRPTGPDTVP